MKLQNKKWYDIESYDANDTRIHSVRMNGCSKHRALRLAKEISIDHPDLEIVINGCDVCETMYNGVVKK